MTKAIKEIIIMLLVCLCTMLVLAILLYKFIPTKKQIPEIAKYAKTEQIEDLLEDNVDEKKDEDRIIYTYEVTKGDLAGYQVSKDYIPGKTNPFEEYSGEPTGEAYQPSGEDSKDKNASQPTEEVTNPSVYKNTSGK